MEPSPVLKLAVNLPISGSPAKGASGFTLVEMLVAIAVLALMLVILSAISVEITRAYTNTSGMIEAFRDARAAFESMTRTISHATLNTYYGYYDSNGNSSASSSYNGTATAYGRQSDLQFVCGNGVSSDSAGTRIGTVTQIPYPITQSIFFVAPQGDTSTTAYIGLNNALNGCGFYVTYGLDPSTPTYLATTTVPKLNRFRLMQFTEPTEYLGIYDPQSNGYPQASGAVNTTWDKWFLGPLAATGVTSLSQLAQNIVALIILPRRSLEDNSSKTSLTANYDYDTRAGTYTTSTFAQLPPVVDVTMVAIDEASALKLDNTSTPPTSLYTDAPFTNPANLPTDLATLENNLGGVAGNAAHNHIHLNFQVFHMEVPLSSAKWSN